MLSRNISRVTSPLLGWLIDKVDDLERLGELGLQRVEFFTEKNIFLANVRIEKFKFRPVCLI